MPVLHHLLELLFFLLLVFSPIPCSALFASRTLAVDHRAPWAHYFLSIISVWLIIHALIAILLGGLGLLNGAALIFVHIVLLFSGVAALVWQRSKGRPLWPDSQPFPSEKQKIFSVLIVIMLLFLLFIIDLALRYPVSEYDSCHVYLPTLAHWYQTGSLQRLSEFGNFRFYPMNPTAISAVFIFPFNEDLAILTPQVVVWLLLGFSVYLISIELGASRIHSAACAGLCSLMQLIVKSIYSFQLDLPLAAFFIASFYALLIHWRSRSPWALALFLGLTGLLIGSKTAAILYGLLLILMAFFMNVKKLVKWVRVRQNRISTNQRFGASTILVVGLIVFLVLGGYWYLRNLFEYGDFTGFFKFEIAKQQASPEDVIKYISGPTLLNTFDVFNPGHWSLLWDNLTEFLGFPFIALLLIAALSPLILALKSKSIRKSHLVTIYILLAVLFLFYAIIPASGGIHQESKLSMEFGRSFRYGFPFFILFTIIASLAATRLNISPEALALLVGISALQFVVGAWLLIIIGLIAILILPAYWGTWSKRIGELINSLSARIRLVFSTVLIVALFIALGFYTDSAGEIRDSRKNKLYGPAYEFVNHQLGADQGIAYAEFMGHMVYYVSNRTISNSVIILSEEPPSLDAWLQELRSRNISLIAVGPPTSKKLNHRVYEWLASPNGPFIKVTEGDPKRVTVIFKIKKAS